MSPYELRFEIFKEAHHLANQECEAKRCYLHNKQEQGHSCSIDYPLYPSYEYIEDLAKRINNFVSKDS